MKKNRILTYIILLLPILFTIGFSSWIIMYTFEFEPVYKANPVSSLFDYSQTVIYNASEQVPKPKDGVTITGDISYEYKLEDDTTFTSGKPINVGTYDVKITIANSDINGTCQVKFIINKKRINFVNQTISIGHGDGKCEPYWQSVQTYVKSQISFVDEKNVAISNTEIVPSDIIFTGMHNGVFSYGTVNESLIDKTDSDMIGSTYVANISLNSQIVNNYEFINGNQIYIKYKTVKLNGSLYTIEDAISAGSGDMTLVGGQTGDMVNTYVKTCFSLVLGNDEYTITNRALHIPYIASSSTSEPFIRNYGTDSSRVDAVYSVLYIPEGIKLYLKNNSRFIVGSYIYQAGLIYNRGVVMNYGEIYLESSKYESYGFTKGTGYIELDSSSEAIDVFRIYDWPGADEAITLKDGNAFPVKKWSVHNISCTLKIFNGALLNSVSYVVALNGYVKIKIDDLYIVGNSSTDNYLFRPSSSATNNDYILKTANITSDTITNSNQTYGQQDKVELYGDYEDGKVEVSVNIYGSFATSTSIAVPISYFDITVARGTLNLINSSYIFQNNTSKLLIESEATLQIMGDAYVALLENSILKLRGTLKGTGTFGGIIDTDVTNAIVEISNFSKTGIVLKTGTTTYDSTISSQATGYIWQNNAISSDRVAFSNGSIYISKVSGSKYYFEGSTDYNTYTIQYNLNGNYDNGLEDTTEEIITSSFPSFEDTYFIDYNGLIEDTKDFYVIEGWYTDKTFSTKFTSTTLTSTSNTLVLYAKWVEKEFSFSYIIEYEDSATGERININANSNTTILNQMDNITKSSFDDGPININITVTYLDKYFNGWYIGNTDNETLKINTVLTYEYFEAYVEQSGFDTIYLYCLFKDFVTYTVIFQNVATEVTGADTIQIQSNQNLTLPNTTTYNGKNTYLNYYAYWSFASYTSTIDDFENNDPTYVINGIKISALVSQIETYNSTQESDKKISLANNQIVIYGKMKEKDYTINYYNAEDELIDTHYYYHSQIGQIKDVIAKDNDDDGSTQIRHTFSHWVNKNNSEDTYSARSSISFESHLELKAVFTPEKYCKISITNSSTTTTVTCNGVTIESGDYVVYGSTISVSITKNSGRYLTVLINGSQVYQEQSSSYETTINVIKHTSIEAKGECVPSGTKITLANGTSKNVEELSVNDLILVFNHETGKFEASPILFMEFDGWSNYELINLKFSNGIVTRLIYEHGYFNKTLNNYVYITKDNYKDFIGDEFIFNNGEHLEKVILVDSYITIEYVGCYSPVTAYHFNFFADGMLSMPGGIDGLFNIFDYDDELKYDAEKMQADIEKYGLLTYDAFKDYMPFEMYKMLPAKYMNIAIGKGMLTFEDIVYYIKKYLEGNDVI